MRLIIVRHGDPNYEIDSLTEKGWREAEISFCSHGKTAAEGSIPIFIHHRLAVQRIQHP